MPHSESWEKLQCDDHSGLRDLYYVLLLYNWGSWGLRQNHVTSCSAIKRLGIRTNSTHYLFLYFTNDSIDVSRKFHKAVEFYQNTRHLKLYVLFFLNTTDTSAHRVWVKDNIQTNNVLKKHVVFFAVRMTVILIQPDSQII